MKKINIYSGKTNGENVVIFENVKDKKIIVLNNSIGEIEKLKEYYNGLIKNNNLNAFYNISDELYNSNVLNEYKTELIATYYE